MQLGTFLYRCEYLFAMALQRSAVLHDRHHILKMAIWLQLCRNVMFVFFPCRHVLVLAQFVFQFGNDELRYF